MNAMVVLSLAAVASAAARGPASFSEPPVIGPVAARLESFPHARGVFLAQVVKVAQYDERPSDGDLFEKVSLRILRSTGDALPSLEIVIESGGFTVDMYRIFNGLPPLPRDPPRYVVRAGTLQVGDSCWFVTAGTWEGLWYPQQVMRHWRANRAGVPSSLARAVESDAYRWHPDFWPDAGLTLGWSDDLSDSTSRIRVWRGARPLWETQTIGLLTHRAAEAWGLFHGRTIGYMTPAALSDSALSLLAEVRIRLDSENEFGVPAGSWLIQYVYDARTGTLLAARVRADRQGNLERVFRSYDPATGRVFYERIVDRFSAGGESVGAPSGEWIRRVERSMDRRTGRVVEEVVRRLAPNGWIDVDHDLGLAAGPPGSTPYP